MLVESLRETAREIARSTGGKVSRVLVGRAVMDAIARDVRGLSLLAAETAKSAGGMRVVKIVGLEIRERPWELTGDVRFEVEV